MTDTQRKGVAIAAVLALLWFAYAQRPLPSPAPDVIPSGPDFLGAFSRSDDLRQAGCDAEAFAGICESVASVLEYDGKQTSPRIDSGVKVDDLRRWVREYALGGGSLKGKYPAVADAAKEYLDKHAGSSGGPMDQASRDRWVRALREMSASSRYAAGRLK